MNEDAYITIITFMALCDSITASICLTTNVWAASALNHTAYMQTISWYNGEHREATKTNKQQTKEITAKKKQMK